jgi:hypothetical protein
MERGRRGCSVKNGGLFQTLRLSSRCGIYLAKPARATKKASRAHDGEGVGDYLASLLPHMNLNGSNMGTKTNHINYK